jgi:nucleoside-diphosphate-sugar epimerase
MAHDLILVTGAGGFIGHSLVAHLTAAGRAFRAVYHHRIPHGQPPHLDTHVVADLGSMEDAAADALLSDVTAVVHLAGRAHVLEETAPDPEAAFRLANVVATERLARAAVRVGVSRFVLASSVKVNGEATEAGHPFTPSDAPAPFDAYARSKLGAESALLQTCTGTAVAPVILRLPLVYGPGVGGNFAVLLDAIARGRSLPVASVRNRRSLLGVDNLVDAIDAVLAANVAPTGVHFVADAESVSVPDLARAVAIAIGVPLEMRRVPVPLLRLGAALLGRGARVRRLVDSLEVDTTSLRAATGWRPRQSLQEGLAATAAWWRLRHSI